VEGKWFSRYRPILQTPSVTGETIDREPVRIRVANPREVGGCNACAAVGGAYGQLFPIGPFLTPSVLKRHFQLHTRIVDSRCKLPIRPRLEMYKTISLHIFERS
jgi:hypothetical protein